MGNPMLLLCLSLFVVPFAHAVTPTPGPLPPAFTPTLGPLPPAFTPTPGPLPPAFTPTPGPLPPAFTPTPGPLPGAPSPGDVESGIAEYGINILLNFVECLTEDLPRIPDVPPGTRAACQDSLLRRSVDLTTCCLVARSTPRCVCGVLNQSTLLSYWAGLASWEQRVEQVCSARGVSGVTSNCGAPV